MPSPDQHRYVIPFAAPATQLEHSANQEAIRKWSDRIPVFPPQNFYSLATPQTNILGTWQSINTLPNMRIYKHENWTDLEVHLMLTAFVGTANIAGDFAPNIDGTRYGSLHFFFNPASTHFNLGRRIAIAPIPPLRAGAHTLNIQWNGTDLRLDAQDWLNVVVTEVLPNPR